MIIVHSGVTSSIPEDNWLEERSKITNNAAIEGYNQLKNIKKNDACVNAVESSINTMESSGLTNSGKGAVLQSDGHQRMDASIMRGWDLEFGSVFSLRGYENPISIARYIMENGNGHNMYAHDFADILVKNKEFRKIKVLNDFHERNNLNLKEKSNSSDTVGAVSLDLNNNICSGTSTGGRSNCQAGRIGDSPIIAAGNYCNTFCGVSLTGYGENVIKLALGKRVVDMVTFQNYHPQLAVDRAISEYGKIFNRNIDTVGIIAIDKLGRYGVGIKGRMMCWSCIIDNNDSTYKQISGTIKNKTTNIQI